MIDSTDILPPTSAPTDPSTASRRGFLRQALRGSAILAAGGLAPVKARAASADPATEIIYMSAMKLASQIRDGKVTAVEAVEAYIARQIEVNDRLNAVVMNSFARARTEAKDLDARAAKGDWAGPLHGVPMTIKDSFDTAGVISTGGTFGRQQYVPEKDATVVARLRAAGAVLLGKSNTPEFTLGGLSGISTTSNLLFGASRNPYDLTRSTSGSSGGAGSIVAAGGAAFDIGTDWGGSIRGPANNNGIAGLKPTSVRVPRTGHIVDYGGMFDNWQQAGPLARRVEDLGLITSIISGPDFIDAACAPVPWRDPSAVDLRRLKVAVFYSNGAPTNSPEVMATVQQAATWLDGEVASVEEDCPTAILQDLAAARSAMTSGDGWAFYLRLVKKWDTKNFSPSRKERMVGVEALSSAALVEAWEKQDHAKSRLLRWIMSKGYDAIICAVAGTLPNEIDRAEGAPGGGGGSYWSYNGTFNSTGWPSAVVRCGWSADGKLPIGVQIVGQPWREDVCLALATLLESKSGGWRKPAL